MAWELLDTLDHLAGTEFRSPPKYIARRRRVLLNTAASLTLSGSMNDSDKMVYVNSEGAWRWIARG